MLRIRFHGRGGQGMKTASRIVGSAAFEAGYTVQDSPVYGAERRGAPIAAFTRIAHEPILERGAIAHPDLVVVADDTLLTEPASQPSAGCDAHSTLLINTHHDELDIRPLTSHGGRVLMADFTTLALKMTQNLASLSTALGTAAASLIGLSLDALLAGLDQELSQSHLTDSQQEANRALARAIYTQTQSWARVPEQVDDVVMPSLELAQITFVPAAQAAPSIFAMGNSPERHTGSWRQFRPVLQPHLAQANALEVHQEVAAAFADQFGRHYGLVEPFQLDDADYVLVMSNAFATKGKAAVQRLRAQGVKAGLLRLRVLRPFPAAQLAEVLGGRKAVAIIDQNLAPGLGGITYQEVATALYGHPSPPPLLSVIGGLGGKDISAAEFDAVFQDMARAAAGHRIESPRLLYTRPEQERMQELLRIAGKEVAL